MSTKNFLIFDLGASNGRAIVANYDNYKFKLTEIYRFSNVPVFAAGTLYWDILRLFSEIKIGIRASFKKFKNITSLGIDSWGVDFGFLDNNGKLLANPYNYRDISRSNYAGKVFKIFPKKKLFELTGGMLIPAMSLFQIYYLIGVNSTEITAGKNFLMIADIFNYFLTGEVFNEFTNFTTTLMYNQREKRLEKKIIEKIGLSIDIFPELINPGRNIGFIKKDICKELEIKGIPLIVPATHDTASAITGIPVTKKHKSWAFISIGTWSIIGKETDVPIINADAFKAGFANLGGTEGKNLLAKDITGLWILQQCREKWIKDKDISWDEIEGLSDSAKDLQSIIDVDDPIFSGVCADMPKKIITACRNNNQEVPQSIGEITKCIFKSLVIKFKINLEMLENVVKEKIEVLHLIGGGTYNSSLCQWIADATGIPVLAGPVETTSIGNLLMQLKGLGEIKTLEDGRIISLNSSIVNYYKPKNKVKWDEVYIKYLKLNILRRNE